MDDNILSDIFKENFLNQEEYIEKLKEKGIKDVQIYVIPTKLDVYREYFKNDCFIKDVQLLPYEYRAEVIAEGISPFTLIKLHCHKAGMRPPNYLRDSVSNVRSNHFALIGGAYMEASKFVDKLKIDGINSIINGMSAHEINDEITRWWEKIKSEAERMHQTDKLKFLKEGVYKIKEQPIGGIIV